MSPKTPAKQRLKTDRTPGLASPHDHEDIDRGSSTSKDSNSWWLCFSLLVVATLVTRFYRVWEPAWVCWDETHFGKMGSWYINRTFFFDVHPPLGKMFIGAVGYLSGYNGTFAFEKPGDLYHDHNYLGMRGACTFLGSCLTPFTFLTVWEFTRSLTASVIAGCLVLFDIGMLILNRYILLDPILLFFISGATYAMAKFRNEDLRAPFTGSWWTWLFLQGAGLGGAISVKFVGLFVVLLVGVQTIWQLWEALGDLRRPLANVMRHLAARALCLIALPLAIYVALFYIHLSVLDHSGNGDGHFSSSFQTSLKGNALSNASMPRHVAFGAVITLKSQRAGGGYLHSHFHLFPAGVGAKQQQITAYAHKDDNNRFIIKKWDSEPPAFFSDEWELSEPELVRHGDLVRLHHVPTGRNVHSHQEHAPVSKKMYQVTGYGEKGVGDANDVWRVEVVGGSANDPVETVTSRLKFHHYFLKCVLTVPGKQLPKWAYEQQEVACNPTTRDLNSVWNVEDNYYPKLENISFGNFAPGFLSRFVESHTVMFTGNAGLKPKEGEYTSRPWEWPVNFRGQYFSGNDHRVYLLGNPIIWWGNLLLFGLFLIVFAYHSMRRQRGYVSNCMTASSSNLRAGGWLLLGWMLHYLPFWGMGRVLYFHHYFPALLYANMLSAVIADHILGAAMAMMPSKKAAAILYHVTLGGILAGLTYSFILFSPLAYGMEETPGHMPNSSVHHLKWLSSWEF